MLNAKLAEIYSVIRPDFTLVDGSCATVHGYYPSVTMHDRALVPFNILAAGRDTLAVDVVCTGIFGHFLGEAERFKRVADFEAGVCELEGIGVKGKPLSDFDRRYPDTLVDVMPPDVKVIRGKEKNFRGMILWEYGVPLAGPLSRLQRRRRVHGSHGQVTG